MAFSGVLLFFLLLAAAVWGNRLPPMIIVLNAAASVMTFIVYARDKSAAQKDQRRTPEKTLHLLALVGGWPGAWLAQRVLRHKSSKVEFQRVFWITVLINCAALAFLSTSYGAAIVQAITPPH
jgi:uncharacterized membrane protein YsdA (DUF1294 family)